MKKTTAEHRRLDSTDLPLEAWRRWGPYLSERQWGTVREDYSPNGTAWDYFPHDHARSRAYRWGEDGIAGFSDERSRLCLGLALWNGEDPILKERLFGLTNSEGNHGEDVKELYYYLDGTPTHSYLRMLYKYPQAVFPYNQLVEENRNRGRDKSEFELLDTGVFDDDRYFDVFVEYAKAGPEDILMKITVHNRGPEPAILHLLPQVWFRNTWSWKAGVTKPKISAAGADLLFAEHPDLGRYQLSFDGSPGLMFSENETNPRIHAGQPNPEGFFKDAFHEAIVHQRTDALNPGQTGTKAAAHYRFEVPCLRSVSVRLRLRKVGDTESGRVSDFLVPSPEGSQFDDIIALRLREADEFYGHLQSGIADADQRQIQRQAFAGMIWSKQFYRFDVRKWLAGDPAQPAPPRERKTGRNADWGHLNNADIISMPDKWEYPWYASWDLAFHCIPLAVMDPEFAKNQLVNLTREWYMHPNGQIPAYEWAFGDVNPPVHAWATWRVFQIDRKACRRDHCDDPGDLFFLERVFHKLLLNFTWWVNRKDSEGRNIFQGGFLGLDNIGVFDRSSPLPTGGFINQSDGTSWMAMYSLNMMRIALELARHNRTYEDIATKFLEHFLNIAGAINGVGEGGLGLWDDTDEFYYDQLHTPDGRTIPLRIRSMVGLIPLFAVETLDPDLLDAVPEFTQRLLWYLEHRPDLANLVSRWQVPGSKDRHLLSLLRGRRMKRLLRRMLDESEFLSDYGVRALSKYHQSHPFCLDVSGVNHEVPYWPGESASGLFGGNSNWRGPIWMPLNYLLIESLQKFHHYYGDEFKVECPHGSGKFITLNQAADEITQRLKRLFLPAADGERPCLKSHRKLSGDPHFKDYVLFHEYFHGESGLGLGASHQTGWTGLIAKLIQPRGPHLQSDLDSPGESTPAGSPVSRSPLHA